jgi:hypothetical protein
MEEIFGGYSYEKGLISRMNKEFNPMWWYMPAIPATRKVEAGRF